MKLASCLVALSLATVSLANPPAADGDYTTLPPDPVELETTLSGLAAAAATAMKALQAVALGLATRRGIAV